MSDWPGYLGGVGACQIRPLFNLSTVLSGRSLRKVVPLYAYWHVSAYHVSHVSRITYHPYQRKVVWVSKYTIYIYIYTYMHMYVYM